ncbi:flagellin [Piscinibacter koreensis]|uniref:Flagellin n=1 Tax=Piscinibacter koreensis TaxID=2742824 RepID=A0A7Y6NMJ0_9BURK|nr:flagellin [Schlegelella koreensis]
MPLSLNPNRLHAGGALDRAQTDLAKITRRLASGLRVAEAADDAAGLAAASRLDARVRGLRVAGRNAVDAVSMAQTAEAALGSIAGNLQRVRELAVQAANASNGSSERAALQMEAAGLVDEIDRVARTTRFNGQALLDGSFSTAALQVGSDPGQTADVGTLASVRAGALGVAPTPPPPTTTSVAGADLTAASTITGPGQLVINGVDVWQGSTVTADAKNLAAAINAAGIAGLVATAAPLTAVGSLNPAASPAGTIFINGSGLYYDFTNAPPGTVTSTMLWLFNQANVWQGTTAVDNGNGLTLTRADGSNVVLNVGTGDPSALGLGGITYGVGTDGVTYSHVDLSYTGSGGLTIAGSKASALGLPPMTAPPPPPTSGGWVSQIDLASAGGAASALLTADAALATVAAMRARLGATQNRFAAALEAIHTESTSASAARSRIVDADYAVEIAALTRAQVLQQSGLAMLAQANSRRADVLKLLRS